MKRIAFALIALLAFVGCTNCAGKSLTPQETHSMDRSVAIISEHSVGHGCYVGGFIFTANHVVTKVKGVNWSDQYGNSGRAIKQANSPFGDLARLLPVEGMDKPVANALKLNPPNVGDEVYWFEYDWGTNKNALREKYRTATVLRVIANHVVLSESPIQGASGGCVFAKGGSVIGIVIWGFNLKKKGEESVGLVARILVADTWNQ